MSAVPPSLGLSADHVDAVLRAASLAPSVYNSQPWLFRVLPDHIELHADPNRRLPATDPENRELRLSCGAALMNLRLALEGHGVRPLVTLLPGDHPGALAVVAHGGRPRSSPDLPDLLRAIRERRTNRRPFVDAPVPAAHRAKLVRAAQAERASVHVLFDRAEQSAVQHLLVRAHRRQQESPLFLTEHAGWTGRTGAELDGVPVSAGGPRPEPQDEWVLRDFTAGHARPRVPGKDFESDPLLLVLSSFDDGPTAGLQAGQALQHLLLTATTLGLAASFLSQPIEVPDIRVELREVLGTRLSPQAILRIGFGSPVPPTPRHPVAELLITESTTTSGGAP